MKTTRRGGHTLVEMLIATAIAAVIIVAIADFLPRVGSFVRSIQIQQKTSLESSNAMDTMVRLLRNGKPTTVDICSCNNNNCASSLAPAIAPNPCDDTLAPECANCQINFTSQDNHVRRFYWQDTTATIAGIIVPANSLVMEEDTAPPNSVPISVAILASNVSNLGFKADSTLTLVGINMTITAPVDGKSVKTLVMPLQNVRLVATQ